MTVHVYTDSEKREALDKWARTLARIVSGLEAVEAVNR